MQKKKKKKNSYILHIRKIRVGKLIFLTEFIFIVFFYFEAIITNLDHNTIILIFIGK